MKNTELIRMADQWDYFATMTRMLEGGELAFPRHVSNELGNVQYPDTPGAWAVGQRKKVIYPDPSDESVAEVLAVANVMDANAEPAYEPADAYVVAMAYELRERYSGSRIIVVSDDVKDRPAIKLSVATACGKLDIECWQAPEFVQHLRPIVAAGT